MVIKLSMAKKGAIKNSKNGVTKKAINAQRYQHTQSDLEYSLIFWNFLPVIIAFILNGLT